MKQLFCLFLVCSWSFTSVNVAIVDSGTDVDHDLLRSLHWKNLDDPIDGIDNDQNFYLDDFYGWNFAESNSEVISPILKNYEFSDDVLKFFRIQEKIFLKTMNQDDIDWLKSKRKDPNYMSELQAFGNFVHGTHVAGIVAKTFPRSHIFTLKIIPTSLPKKIEKAVKPFQLNWKLNKSWQRKVLKMIFRTLAREQMILMKEIAWYLKDHNIRIANGSFGTSYSQLSGLIKMLLPKVDSETLDATLRSFFSELVLQGSQMAAMSPGTLFVYAAGNDGTNNDLYPTSPANIEAKNVISVASTFRNRLASYSNYGENKVHVAAKGTLIESSIPNNRSMKLSGTSQAAPYVSGIAASILEKFPNLSPKKLKAILIESCQKKTDLLGKVRCGGFVTKPRAIKFARSVVNREIELKYTPCSGHLRKSTQRTLRGKSLEELSILPLPSLL